MCFAVWATDRPGMWAERQRVREAHCARLRARLGGPTLDRRGGPMNGTLRVIEAEHIDAVRGFVAEDPYLLAGVYAAVDIRPWAWGLGQPEEETSP